MNKIAKTIIVAFVCITGATAQVVIEPEVVTDSIDIFSNQKQSKKSSGLAMVANILIPGLGHQYMGNSGRALSYFTAEAAFIFGLAFTEGYSRKMFRDSRAYAGRYAVAPGGDGADEYYWKNVGNDMSRDDYNNKMELSRTPEDKYDVNLDWQWDDESRRDDYNQMREDATFMRVGSSFFLAAMVLNRAIAFIDIRRSLNYKGVTRHALRFKPHHDLTNGQSGITLSGKF